MLQKSNEKIRNKIKTAEKFEEFIEKLNKNNAVLAPWCENDKCEEEIKTRSSEESK